MDSVSLNDAHCISSVHRDPCAGNVGVSAPRGAAANSLQLTANYAAESVRGVEGNEDNKATVERSDVCCTLTNL